MIERHSGRMQIVCECGTSQRRTYAADEFDVMVADAKAEGFVITKIAGQWDQSCGDCAATRRARPSQGSLL